MERVGEGEPPKADRLVELPGCTIIPGFIDSHVHLSGTGIRLADPGVADARSAGEMLQNAAGVSPRRSGVVFAHGYDESKWTHPRVPAMADLDGSVRGPLVIVRTDGHASLANSAALRAAGVEGLPGLEMDEGGSPTGMLTREANEALQRWCLDGLGDAEIEDLQLQGAALAASRGVTCVHEMSLPSTRGPRDLEILLGHRRRLPVDVVVYPASTDIPMVLDMQLSRIGGDLSLDGSIGARTANLTRSYSDGDGMGVSYIPEGDLFAFLHNAHLAGLQVGLHVIGDRAIRMAIDCWERVYQALDSRARRHFRARRHRLEHFEMPTPDDIERVAMLGLAVSTQPAFDAEWGHPGSLYEIRLGEERASRMNPFRTLMKRGIEIGSGSDSPITDLDPMRGIEAFASHHLPNERLTREEAIRTWCVGGARLAHLEDKKGHLGPGSHADLAAYDSDPLTAEDIRGLRPVLTVSLGREVSAS